MAAGAQGEDTYASLLLTDTYLPGALVLAHSLRDAGTAKKLTILVTLDSVSAEVITQLKSVYDYIVPVSRVRNDKSTKLSLMNRPDLHSAFTKINLWRQTQFRKIVYVDADVLAYRAPDELFDLPHAFAAAPDIGWPDIFNTGVMVLTPNQGDYYALMALAERRVSFDGADQGLLNIYFKDYHRLSFNYNVTPSPHYQYTPAYMHFQSSINMVHFIGNDKPWLQGRKTITGNAPFDEIVGRWWSVYDRHYREQTPATPASTSGPASSTAPPEIVQYFVKGEWEPRMSFVIPVGEFLGQQFGPLYGQHFEPLPPASFPMLSRRHQNKEHGFLGHENRRFTHQHQHDYDTSQSHDGQVQAENSVQALGLLPSLPHQSVQDLSIPGDESRTEARIEQESKHKNLASPTSQQRENKPEPVAMTAAWDAQWQPPPADSKPEAANFPKTHYEMSSDTNPFVPPQRYPSPPKNMWYEVPKEAPASPTSKPKAIFPWEEHRSAPTRVFAGLPPLNLSPSSEGRGSAEPRSQAESSGARQPMKRQQMEPLTPSTPTIKITQAWNTFTRTNAWDEVPGIEKYVDGLQQNSRRKTTKGLKLSGLHPSGYTPEVDDSEVPWRKRGFRVTDFPLDRPSLPVTPAPLKRSVFWGDGGGSPSLGGLGADDKEKERLPAAVGVPAQSDWDPVAQLQKLARQQSELLQQKLGNAESGGIGGRAGGNGNNAASNAPAGNSRDHAADARIPSRVLPLGSEKARSPTYVAAHPPPTVISPQPRKPCSETNSVRSIGHPDTLPMLNISRTQHMSASFPRSSSFKTAPPSSVTMAMAIQEPSYSYPGRTFEKDDPGDITPQARLPNPSPKSEGNVRDLP